MFAKPSTRKKHKRIGKELADNSIDAKLAKIKAKTGSAKARQRLAALRKKRALQAGGGGGAPSGGAAGGAGGGSVNFNKRQCNLLLSLV